METRLGMVFDGSHRADNYKDVERMQKQLQELGGMLHFSIIKDKDGWMARCSEVDGLITGGSNIDPGNFEVESRIRDAIYTAFHMKTKIAPEFLRSEITQVAWRCH